VINASTTPIAATERLAQPAQRVRPGARLCWITFAVEAALVSLVLMLLVPALLPARPPLTKAPDHALVREAVVARLSGATPDPLTDVAPGVTVRSSNLRGFALNGVTYYYYLEGQSNADPLSRGALSPDQVAIVLRDTSGPVPLVVYTLLSKERATGG